MPDWNEIKAKIQKSEDLSPFKKKYLIRLVDYGEEFENCGRIRTSELMYERILKQRDIKSARYTKFNFEGGLDFKGVTEQLHTRNVDDAIRFLEKHAHCMPDEEKKIFKYQIMEYKKPPSDNNDLNQDEKDKRTILPKIQKERINSLRQTMLEKVVRFRQKQSGNKRTSHLSKAEFPEVIGIYNNKFNVCEVLDHLNQFDSLLVDDLKSHYRKICELKNLFK